MKLADLVSRNLELNPLIPRKQLHVVPRDDRGLKRHFEVSCNEAPQAFETEPTQKSKASDIYVGDVEVLPNSGKLQIVNPDHACPVCIDKLLVEYVAGKKEIAFIRNILLDLIQLFTKRNGGGDQDNNIRKRNKNISIPASDAHRDDFRMCCIYGSDQVLQTANLGAAHICYNFSEQAAKIGHVASR